MIRLARPRAAAVFLLAAIAPVAAPRALAQGPLPAEIAAAASRPLDAARSLRGGRLEERDGARVLHLEGTVAERGYAEGFLLADELFACFEEFALGHVVAGRAKAWDLLVRPGVRARFAFDAESEAWAEAVIAGARDAREGDLRLRALGRDLDAFDLLAGSAIPDLAGFLCSSFAAFGDATESGDVVVGRNLDYPSTPAVERHSIVRVQAGDGERAAWIGVGWPGSTGCLTGLSERGVFVAVHDVYRRPVAGAGRATPRVIALQRLVESATPSADLAGEAAERLRAHRFAMGANVLVAWQGGGSRGAAVLELDSDRANDAGVTVRVPADGESFVACSNHHRARSRRPASCDRYGVLVAGCEAGGLDLPLAWELIASSGLDITLYRCVADLGAKVLEVERQTDEGWQPRVRIGFARE